MYKVGDCFKKTKSNRNYVTFADTYPDNVSVYNRITDIVSEVDNKAWYLIEKVIVKDGSLDKITDNRLMVENFDGFKKIKSKDFDKEIHLVVENKIEKLSKKVSSLEKEISSLKRIINN